MSTSTKSLKWRFDVNTFRLLGRELITDRTTALFELVKNCYDANATEVSLIFENVSPNSSDDAKIIISDNGCGMSFKDIRDKWMVVGTASKRKELYSPAPFNRRYVGEKGIGRFAVDKLGGQVIIKTKQKNESNKLVVNIDWEEYDRLSNNRQLTLFTDIDNDYYFEPSPLENHGTDLIISSIEDKWTDIDMIRLERELEKIVSPYIPLNPPFNIRIKSNEFKSFENKLVKAESVKYSSHQFELNYNLTKNVQNSLFFNQRNGQMEIQNIPLKSFGPINFKLYYFNLQAKRDYNKAYKNNIDHRIDGIKIYRDGLITTPFAEYESDRDKKRDILGIDKRIWTDAFNRISSREVIGIINITKELNNKIVDSTNRQNFVDNQEYQDLKDFIIKQLTEIENLKKYERELSKAKTDLALERANSEVKEFTTAIKAIESKNPKLKQTLGPLKKQAQLIDKSLKRGIAQQKKERQEHIRKENIYLSLMSLQDYAIHISHAVRTALGKVKRKAEFFKERFPDPKLDELFKEYSNEIYEEMSSLNKVIDFMLSYAASNIAMADFNIKDLLTNLIIKSYKPVFDAENIHASINIKDNFIVHANKKFFEDIFENLISNSLKALRNEDNKIIKCTGFIENNQFVMYFSDNGEGIKNSEIEKIFEMYYTTTADLGGAGLGLYIVKTRVESLNGSISVVDSEFKPKGATFKLIFPFKK